MLHTVSVFSYTVTQLITKTTLSLASVHSSYKIHHTPRSVCSVISDSFSVLLTQTVTASFSSKSITPVQFTCRTLCYHAQLRYGAVCLQTACSASSSWLSPLLKTCIPLELTRKTLRGTLLQLEKALEADDVQPLPRIARHRHHSPSQCIWKQTLCKHLTSSSSSSSSSFSVLKTTKTQLAT